MTFLLTLLAVYVHNKIYNSERENKLKECLRVSTFISRYYSEREQAKRVSLSECVYVCVDG